MTGRSNAFRAFETWRQLVLDRDLPVVLLRPKPFEIESAFEGDFDYVHDPEALALIVRAALDACIACTTTAELQQGSPHKTRLRFWSEDGTESILLELWPHTELGVPQGDGIERGVIEWSALRPLVDAPGSLPARILGLIFVTHLRFKGKDLAAAQVRTRLEALRATLADRDERDARVGALIGRLADGKITTSEANVEAHRLLAVEGVAVTARSLTTVRTLATASKRRAARLLHRGGLVPLVPVVGPDGAGKSAVIAALRALPAAEAPKVDRFTFKQSFRGSFTLRRIIGLAVAVSARRGRPVTRNVAEEHHPHVLLLTALARWPWVRFRTSRQARANGGAVTVLADRYFWDFLVRCRDPERPPNQVPGHRTYSRIVPRPTAAVVLVCSSPVLRSRKEELSVEAIDYVYDAYCRQVTAARVDRVLLLSTEQPLDRAAAQLAHFLAPR